MRIRCNVRLGSPAPSTHGDFTVGFPYADNSYCRVHMVAWGQQTQDTTRLLAWVACRPCTTHAAGKSNHRQHLACANAAESESLLFSTQMQCHSSTLYRGCAACMGRSCRGAAACFAGPELVQP